ncbi:MAG: hypothetical protein IT371_12255 [Deltaproteobacteria bacterium]|nr:hypothetical protein [Deltaproteobacteria bacterium]
MSSLRLRTRATLLCTTATVALAGCSSGSTPYFPSTAPWYQDVSTRAKDPESDKVIDGLQRAGGWAHGVFVVNFLMTVLIADDASPVKTFTPTEDFYTPDCDHEPMPVPVGGAVEGSPDYRCPGPDQDCHLIVVHRDRRRLYEMWRADIQGSSFRGGCLATWDLDRDYGPSGRGEQCSSADAAGMPIAPLLPTADEVQSGAVEHAMRFILPNGRIRAGVYVHPATHSTPSAAGGDDKPPYGARLRLRANFPVERLPSEGARVLAVALQRYGMLLADGGEAVLPVQSDRNTQAKWRGLLDTEDLRELKVTDFEMVDAGPRLPYTGHCTRNR